MSITKSAAIFGFGSRWRISYFLYDGQIPPPAVAASAAAALDLGLSIVGCGDIRRFRRNRSSEFGI